MTPFQHHNYRQIKFVFDHVLIAREKKKFKVDLIFESFEQDWETIEDANLEIGLRISRTLFELAEKGNINPSVEVPGCPGALLTRFTHTYFVA